MIIVVNIIHFYSRFLHFSFVFDYVKYINLVSRKSTVCFSILYILSSMSNLRYPTASFKEPNLVDIIHFHLIVT